MAYTYDNGGNLSTKIDARNITTTYTYDSLSRVLTCSCTNDPTSTPTVTYTYDDTNVAFGIGKLTKVSSSVSETAYTAFDALGRVLSSKQTTSGLDVCTGTSAPCVMSYTYNLASELLSETYPSGRVVKNVYNNSGEMIQVFGKATNKPITTYANQFKYAATGAVEGMRLGNNRWESTVFNSRLQPTQIALGTTPNATDLLKLNYEYGELATNGTVDATKNNGNVGKQTITVPTVGANPGFTAVQNYTYDQLNRLGEAKETTNSTQNWIQTFNYDRYGNRTIDPASNKTTSSLIGPNPDVSTTNNRIVPRTGEHYHFDAAGNMDVDKDNHSLVYDGENKLITYNGGATNGGANYVYDGDGKRVKKITSIETIIFIYNASGQMVAEYSTTPTTTNGTISYLTSDNLGTPRINTDASGQVSARHDYLPFGEEIIAGQTYSGGRTNALGYVADDVRQKFTGYERDEESDLDFAQARMYSSQIGRFTTPDDFLNDTYKESPSSWNLYIYCRNNPLTK